MIGTMSQNCAYVQKESKNLDRYIKFFASKVIQAVVQSRTAVMKKSRSKANSTSYDWFNVAIEDEPSIRENAARALMHQRFLSDFSMCIEIQLQTIEDESLVLETWCLSLRESCDPSAKMSSVYPRMCVLLKSIIAVSRVSPAYKLAVRQTPDSYTLHYKIYFGPPQVHILGEDFQENRIGQVVTPVGILSMSLAYRTKMSITPQQNERGNTFMVKSDYFKPDLSPKKVRPTVMNGFHADVDNLDKDAHHNSAVTSNGTSEPVVNGCHQKYQLSLADSDQEFNGCYKRTCGNGTSEDYRVSGAFASMKFPDESLFPDLILPSKPIINLPSSSLLCSVERKLSEEEKSPDKNANLCVASIDNKLNNPHVEVDYNCNASNGCSAKMLCSESLECDDFVMVELKPPFADSDSSSDLCAFFRECKCAPPLASFAGQPSLKEQVSDITNQLAKFETSMQDFDSFVDGICQGDNNQK